MKMSISKIYRHSLFATKGFKFPSLEVIKKSNIFSNEDISSMTRIPGGHILKYNSMIKYDNMDEFWDKHLSPLMIPLIEYNEK